MPPDGWFPEQRLTFEETLHAYTLGAALAVGKDAELGSLEKGKSFDLSVFDQDCREGPGCWLFAKVTATVVGGHVVVPQER